MTQSQSQSTLPETNRPPTDPRSDSTQPPGQQPATTPLAPDADEDAQQDLEDLEPEEPVGDPAANQRTD